MAAILFRVTQPRWHASIIYIYFPKFKVNIHNLTLFGFPNKQAEGFVGITVKTNVWY